MANLIYFFWYDDKDGNEQMMYGSDMEKIKRDILAINPKANLSKRGVSDASVISFCASGEI